MEKQAEETQGEGLFNAANKFTLSCEDIHTRTLCIRCSK